MSYASFAPLVSLVCAAMLQTARSDDLPFPAQAEHVRGSRLYLFLQDAAGSKGLIKAAGEAIPVEALASNFTEHMRISEDVPTVAKQIDTDSDGRFSEDEFLTFVEPKLAKIWAIDEFNDADLDNSTTLTYEEWQDSPMHEMQVENLEHSVQFFKRLSTDSNDVLSKDQYAAASKDSFTFIDGLISADNKISLKELRKFATYLSSQHLDQVDLPIAVTTVFNKADKSGKGFLTRAEWATVNHGMDYSGDIEPSTDDDSTEDPDDNKSIDRIEGL